MLEKKNVTNAGSGVSKSSKNESRTEAGVRLCLYTSCFAFQIENHHTKLDDERRSVNTDTVVNHY